MTIGEFDTHEVTNQPTPLTDYNVFESDVTLSEALDREGGSWARDELNALGAIAGSRQAQEWAVQANACTPVLHTHDRYGCRLDEVEFHPAYHELLGTGVAYGLDGAPWADSRPGAHVVRAAGFMTWAQAESSVMCPISMTYSVVPALRAEPDLAAIWEPRIASREYDPSFAPADTKTGVMFGMAMTEKQGGSDVRANTTRAEPVEDGYLLTGHKWFVSAPMSDAFLVLAQAPAGLTCFLVPRWRPDATANTIRIQRLKDKLGNRANASSEIELQRSWASRVGEEGRGVATIIEMVNRTRLDCTLGSASGMRLGVANATHHCAHRSAFGRTLIDQPLMRNVLADLVVESDAATITAMRLAGACDRNESDFARLATAVSKYWICKRALQHAGDALECFGGAGYVEESLMPRLLRDSPLNGIWEGSGNVICLDVLRAMAKMPESVAAFIAELDAAKGADKRYDAAVTGVTDQLAALERSADPQFGARRLVESMATTFQAGLLLRFGHPSVADAFCASRLDASTTVFGTLPDGADTQTIIERARPKVA